MGLAGRQHVLGYNAAPLISITITIKYNDLYKVLFNGFYFSVNLNYYRIFHCPVRFIYFFLNCIYMHV